eukprot:14153362-Heterocapsa_arctica.AAC.1
MLQAQRLGREGHLRIPFRFSARSRRRRLCPAEVCKDAAACHDDAARDRFPADLVVGPVAISIADDVVDASGFRQPDADVLRSREVAPEALEAR